MQYGKAIKILNRLILANTCCILLSAGTVFSQTIKLEAENATLDGVTVSSSLSGYSGDGYVSGFDNQSDKITFNFESDGGLHTINVRYAVPSGYKEFNMDVNGVTSVGKLEVGESVFLTVNTGKFDLQEGSNQVTIKYGWGYYYIDYIEVKPAEPLELLTPSDHLVDADVPDYVRTLFNYLLDNYGEKVISGQQELHEIQYVINQTGKSPAIGGFDFMDYSPSRTDRPGGTNPEGFTESWIDWQQEGGGIVTMMWHWNAPIDLIDEEGKEWWRGFYSDATTFDLAAALADKESEEYELLIRDIDVIAAELQKFEDAQIPVLWRPLHEASGGWFWWGAKGPEAFIELWRLLFDRITNHHEINNLIWVYTAENPDWYPGDNYVDIVGLDIYTDQSSTMSANWEIIQERFNQKKVVTLSESGTIPEPDEINTFGTWWSYFVIWNGNDFIRNINTSLLNEVYNHEDIITLDELPDWSTYEGGDHSAPEQPSEPGEVTGVKKKTEKMSIFPNPTEEYVIIRFNQMPGDKIEFTVFDELGKKVIHKSISENQLSENEFHLDTRRLNNGIYFINVESGTTVENLKFIKE